MIARPAAISLSRVCAVHASGLRPCLAMAFTFCAAVEHSTDAVRTRRLAAAESHSRAAA